MKQNKYYQDMHPLGAFTIIILDQNNYDVSVLLCYTMTDIDDVRERDYWHLTLSLLSVCLQIWNKVQFIEIGTVIGGSYQITYVNLREEGLLGLQAVICMKIC